MGLSLVVVLVGIYVGISGSSSLVWPLTGKEISKEQGVKNCDALMQKMRMAHIEGNGYELEPNVLNKTIDVCKARGSAIPESLLLTNRHFVKCDKTINALRSANVIEFDFNMPSAEFGQILADCSPEGRDTISHLKQKNEQIKERADGANETQKHNKRVALIHQAIAGKLTDGVSTIKFTDNERNSKLFSLALDSGKVDIYLNSGIQYEDVQVIEYKIVNAGNESQKIKMGSFTNYFDLFENTCGDVSTVAIGFNGSADVKPGLSTSAFFECTE